MGFEVKTRDVEIGIAHDARAETREDERKGKDQGRETDAEREHVDDTIGSQGNLLRNVIKAKANSRYKR